MGRLARETLFTLFYDWGHVKYKHDPSNQPLGFLEAQTFSGYGLGFTWERPKQFSTRISIAWPHRGTPQNDSVQRIPRVYATLTVPF
jgi:hemolysin activation/secretion protein